MPEEDRNNVKNIANLNPGWQSILWDERMILDILTNHPKVKTFYQNLDNLPVSPNNISVYASKSDVARWVIMYEKGGCYMDTDVVCTSGLDEIVAKVPTGFVASGNLKPIWSGQFFMAPAKNELFKKIIEDIPNSVDRRDLGGKMTNVFNHAPTGVHAIDPDDLSVYHCGVASKCMIPIKPVGSASVYSRQAYYAWCKHKNTIGTIFLILISFLAAYILYIFFKTKGWLGKIDFNTCSRSGRGRISCMSSDVTN